eukprot:TRINITY_DN1142_c0_g1_i3.p1 TRINITY_DN1142_c0_g1~~TRINITY_DN1142_c0_g1_i3.p1  ORF type:complete len:121 (+),score=23.96 TRINITY_DN1142_c0_g1_i3:328-690(+)
MFESLSPYDILENNKDATDWGEKKYDYLTEDLIQHNIKEKKWELLDWDMEPGDLIAFHFLTLHGAPGNSCPTSRRAVAFRWTGDDATITLKRPWKVSPPILSDKSHGEPLDSDLFPIILK